MLKSKLKIIVPKEKLLAVNITKFWASSTQFHIAVSLSTATLTKNKKWNLHLKFSKTDSKVSTPCKLQRHKKKKNYIYISKAWNKCIVDFLVAVEIEVSNLKAEPLKKVIRNYTSRIFPKILWPQSPTDLLL